MKDPIDAWVGAFFCLMFAFMLLGNVLSGGTQAPHFAYDLGWMAAWSLGAVACTVTAIVRLTRGGDDG